MFFEDRSLAPYEGDEPYLFLSYSHKDSEKAGKIIRVLKKNGFRVWYDEGITPGAEWDFVKIGSLYGYMMDQFIVTK